MLPSRAYAAPLSFGRHSQPSQRSSPDVRPTVVAVVGSADLRLFPTTPYTCLAAHTSADAVRLIQSSRPRIVALDLDLPGADAPAICRAARQHAETSILVMTASVTQVPPALKAGCHAVLLKPVTINLVAARLGRLCREHSAATPGGTNRAWPDAVCPTCGHLGAIGFEFSSHRQTWYACQACDAVWLGPRRE